MTIYTVGHGTRATSELITVLQANQVERLVDVRRYPRSRRNPHLSREELARSLPESGIAYDWRGDALGGRRSGLPKGRSRHHALRVAGFQGYADHMDTDVFREELQSLIVLSERELLCLMCAETLWWKCHRRMIADALVLAGVDVVHLRSEAARDAHRLHPACRAGDDGRPVYDVGATGRLPFDERNART